MTRTPHTSKQIASSAHDPVANVMELEFVNRNPKKKVGGVYQFQNIMPEKYQDFLDAESKGKFFSDEIKPFPDLYPFTKMPEEEA